MSERIAFQLSNNGQYYICMGYVDKSLIRHTEGVIIPSTYNNLPVKAIRESAFEGTGISRAIIPNSITSIGKRSFANNPELTKIIIPYSVNSIGDEAFSDCTKLSEIVFLSRGLFSCRKNNGIFANAGANNENGCTLKCGYFVEKIPDRLFYPYTNGDSTPNLQKVFFEKGRKKSTDTADNCILDSCTNIGFDAFKGCVDLMSVELPSKLTTISQGAFDQCYRLVEVLNYADTLTDKLEDKFPYGLRRISFDGGTILQSNISQDNGSIVKNISNEWVAMPCFVLDNTIINIGRFDTSFENIIQIKAEVDYDINNYAFYKKNLNQIYIGQFSNIYGLPEITPPAIDGYGVGDTVTRTKSITSKIRTIGDYAFFGNQNLHYCLIGNELSGLGAFAFSQTKLAKISNQYAKAWEVKRNVFTGFKKEWQEIVVSPSLQPEGLIHISGDYRNEKFIHSESLADTTTTTFVTNKPTFFCPYAFKQIYRGNKSAHLTKFNFSTHDATFSSNTFEGTNFSSLEYIGTFNTMLSFPNNSIKTATINANIEQSFEQNKLETLTINGDIVKDNTLPLSLITLQIANAPKSGMITQLFNEYNETDGLSLQKFFYRPVDGKSFNHLAPGALGTANSLYHIEIPNIPSQEGTGPRLGTLITKSKKSNIREYVITNVNSIPDYCFSGFNSEDNIGEIEVFFSNANASDFTVSNNAFVETETSRKVYVNLSSKWESLAQAVYNTKPFSEGILAGFISKGEDGTLKQLDKNKALARILSSVPSYIYYGSPYTYNITINNTCQTIGEYSFYNTKLSELTINLTNLQSIGFNAFGMRTARKLTKLAFDGEIENWLKVKLSDWNSNPMTRGFETDGLLTFNNQRFRTFSLDDSNLRPQYHFRNCPDLTSVTIKRMLNSNTALYAYEFSGCNKIETLEALPVCVANWPTDVTGTLRVLPLPSGTTDISISSSIKSAITVDLAPEIGDYVKKIGPLKSGLLSNLTQLQSLRIYSLKWNKSTEDAYFSKGTSMFYNPKFDDEGNVRKHIYSDTVGTPLTALFGTSSFNNSVLVEQMSSISTSGDIFVNSVKGYIPTSLTSLYIECGYIGHGALSGLSNLTNLKLTTGSFIRPNRYCLSQPKTEKKSSGSNTIVSVKEINESSKLKWTNNNITFLKENGNNSYKCILSIDGDATIPLNTSIIADYAAAWKSYAISIISKNLTYIGVRALAGATLLGNLSLSLSSLTCSEVAYMGCDSIKCGTDFTVDVGVIGDYAFQQITSIENLTLSENVYQIGASVFRPQAKGTSKIKKITVAGGSHFKHSGDKRCLLDYSNCLYLYAMGQASTETAYIIPSGVTKIKKEAFYGYGYSLKTLTIPASVYAIEDGAFNRGTYDDEISGGLTKINIKKSFGSITGSPWGAAKASISWGA